MKKYLIIFAILCLGVYLFLNRDSKLLKQEVDPLEYKKKKTERIW